MTGFQFQLSIVAHVFVKKAIKFYVQKLLNLCSRTFNAKKIKFYIRMLIIAENSYGFTYNRMAETNLK